MVQGKGDSKFDFQAPQVHRYTPDGLPVYKYAKPFLRLDRRPIVFLPHRSCFFPLVVSFRYFELGMKQDDGGTGQCPFDCSCCY
jgi:hypothetical protein